MENLNTKRQPLWPWWIAILMAIVFIAAMLDSRSNKLQIYELEKRIERLEQEATPASAVRPVDFQQ